MLALSVIGVLLCVVFIIFFCYKGYSPCIVAPIGALIMAIFSGITLGDFMANYAETYANMARGVFFTYLISMVFAQVLQETGAAYSIAYWLADHIGPKFACTVVMLACGILTAGGMNCSAYFIVYPIGLVLCSKAGYSNRAVAAAAMAAPWSWGIISPLMPSVHNTIAINFLGTNPQAGLIPGLAGGIFLLLADIVYLEWQTRCYTKKGFAFNAHDMIPQEKEGYRESLPPVWRAILPLVIVLVCYNGFNLNINYSIAIGAIAAMLLEARKLGKGAVKVMERGALAALVPVGCLCAVAGIGGIITVTPFFAKVLELLQSSTLHPYLLALVSCQILGFSLGSASSTISTSLTTLTPIYEGYVARGFSLGSLHRLTVFGSTGLSALPSSGGVAGTLAVFKTSYKESYWPVCVICCILPIIAGFCIVLPLSIFGL